MGCKHGNIALALLEEVELREDSDGLEIHGEGPAHVGDPIGVEGGVNEDSEEGAGDEDDELGKGVSWS